MFFFLPLQVEAQEKGEKCEYEATCGPNINRKAPSDKMAKWEKLFRTP